MPRKWDGTETINQTYSQKVKAKLYHTPVRAAIWDKTDGRCWYCGIMTHPWRTFCIDHVVPTRKDGEFKIDNLVPCCRGCNIRKKYGTLKEMRESFKRSLNKQTYVFYFETIQIGKEWIESYLKKLRNPII